MNLKTNVRKVGHHLDKKGFTLIELLAVIVILAIIAVIATPIVLNIIKDSKASSSERSAENYIDAVEQAIAKKKMNDVSFNPSSCTIATASGQSKLTCDGEELQVEINGEYPKEGTIKLSNGKIDKVTNLKLGNYYINKSNNKLVSTTNKVYVCKRATTLHTEECTQPGTTYYCSGAGYSASGSKGTPTITYGNLGTPGTLTSGDAFDCDVNGDKTYDPITERFYYLSGKDGDNNSEYATLIYYNNVSGGVANNTALYQYYSAASENWHGPETAKLQLPTTTQWSNVSLSNTTRALTTEKGETANEGGTFPTDFSYEGYAARLLTAQELLSACNITTSNWGSAGSIYTSTCDYLMENTKYSSETLGTYGYWLETPSSSNRYNAWGVFGGNSVVNYDNTAGAYFFGVRPVIEALKSDISY